MKFHIDGRGFIKEMEFAIRTFSISLLMKLQNYKLLILFSVLMISNRELNENLHYNCNVS